MKTLWQIMSELFKLDKDPDGYYYNYKEVKKIIATLLNEYEQAISKEEGWREAGDWPCQMLNELRETLCLEDPQSNESQAITEAKP